jgi:acyl-CoA reductase-like NAD-dependent aldehyde dehydrogenase
MTQSNHAEREHWAERARSMTLPCGLFVDGQLQEALSDTTLPVFNPATGAVLAQMALAGQIDVDRAVAGARAAFAEGRWRKVPPRERGRRLLHLSALIEAHRDELALLETLCVGKPIADSLSVDLRAAARTFAWYGEAVDKVYDQLAPVPANALAMVTREPLGVVAAVVPWNFPLHMAAWKVAPALATGNSVVLKPAEQSPLSALRLGELAIEAGIPPGVLQVVCGDGPTTGAALGLHGDVDCVAFTGSTEVGKLFLGYAGASNMKRVWLECGGKTAHVVLADCPDLKRAAAAAADAIFFNQGEMCSAGSRLLLDAAIAGPFMELLVEQARRYAPGDPLDPGTRMGALVSTEQLERVLGYIRQAQADGARLVTGGRRCLEETGGWFVEPTIFDGVDPRSPLAQEEVFGPVLAVMTFRDEAEALAIANGTPYGLAAAVWTADLNCAHRLARELRAGTVWVNCFEEGDMTVPFGGFGQSGFGRDKSLHALDKYTDLKATWVALAP